MVTRNKPEITADKGEKKGRVRVGKLQLNKETVRDLTRDEGEKIKGGRTTSAVAAAYGGYVYFGCIGDKYPNQ